MNHTAALSRAMRHLQDAAADIDPRAFAAIPSPAGGAHVRATNRRQLAAAMEALPADEVVAQLVQTFKLTRNGTALDALVAMIKDAAK